MGNINMEWYRGSGRMISQYGIKLCRKGNVTPGYFLHTRVNTPGKKETGPENRPWYQKPDGSKKILIL